MFHVHTIKNWFKGKAEDFNKIAEFLNNLCGDGFIRVTRPDIPSNGAPPTISLDVEKVLETVGKESAKTGSVTDVTGHFANDFEEAYDTPPITPAQGATDLWASMTKDEAASSAAGATVYKGWKENAIIAIEADGGAHKIWYVSKEYTADGRLKTVSPIKGMTMIGA